MEATKCMKVLFIIAIAISLGEPASPTNHEMVESPLLKEIAQKKALFYNNQQPLKKVVIVRKQPITSAPAPVKEPPPIKNTTKVKILKLQGKDGVLQTYKLIPVTDDNSDKNDASTVSENPIPKESPRPKKSTRSDINLKQTPTNDRVFIPPYKFPFFGNPYGIYSNAGFINPGLFPFVPGGPGFPPYDGVFGGPFGPGLFPGNPGNPYPPLPSGNSSGLPMDIPGTLAALGYGQPPLNPTGPPPGAYSPGSPVGYKRSRSTEKPPRTSSARPTPSRGKYKPKPKPTPANSGYSGSSDEGGCNCGKGKGHSDKYPSSYRRRTTTTSTTPASTCRCSSANSNRYRKDKTDDEKSGSRYDVENTSPPAASPPCPYTKPEKNEKSTPYPTEASTKAPSYAPPEQVSAPPTTITPPTQANPPCKLKSAPNPSSPIPYTSPPPPQPSTDKPMPEPSPEPCAVKQPEENSFTQTYLSTTEVPPPSVITTAPMYPPQPQHVYLPSSHAPPPSPMRQEVVVSSPPPQMMVASPQPYFVTQPPPPQNHPSVPNPQHHAILYKPIPQEIVHTPTSVTVPLPFPFVMDSNGMLQPQSQLQGSEVTYKLDLNSDLLTKISTPIDLTQQQQIRPAQGTRHQYYMDGQSMTISPQQPQVYPSHPRSRVLVADQGSKKAKARQPSVIYSTEATAPKPSVVVMDPESFYNSRYYSSTSTPVSTTRQHSPKRKGSSSHTRPAEYPAFQYSDYPDDEEMEEPHAQPVRRRYKNERDKKSSNKYVIIDRAELEELQRTSTASTLGRNTNDYYPTTERNVPPPSNLIHLEFHSNNDEDINKPLSFSESRYYNHNYERDKASAIFDMNSRNVRSAPAARRRTGGGRGHHKKRGMRVRIS